MKNIVCLLFFACLFKMSAAQTDSTVLYYNLSNVPAFTITKVPDSTKFTKADLLKANPSIIIFFSPDCEHCQKETQKLTAGMELLKKPGIIMVSAMEHHFNKTFFEDYKIADYPNIILGREPTLALGTYLKVHSLPTTYVYDKKGNFIKVFKGNIPVEEIAALLKQ